ncbi:MAG: hypothetical protein PGN16_18620 [Sphingomonas phyllosphaerae]|uniref:hypothetical protein n=1 Tax=Sphingomonas phyllosphaerae TaxID=257003 RepID=UPI002FF6F90C
MRDDDPEPTLTRLVPRQFVLLLLAPLLAWPAMVNGSAFFFDDTAAYIRGVDALAVRTLGRSSDWTIERTLKVAQRTPQTARAKQTIVAPTVRAEPGSTNKPILTGRSPFYGALAYLGVLFGTFWIVVAVQTLAATAALIGVVRHAVDPARERAFMTTAVAVIAIALLTPLPYFACMLMPDIFAGLAILAAAVLLSGWRRETPAGRVGWVALAGYGALTHSATTLILLAIAGSAGLLLLVRRRIGLHPRAIALVAAAGLLGLVGDTSFGIAIERATGAPPIRPPFLTARLTADGVGTDYARAHCATEHWVICRHLDQLPLHSDSFLWSGDPATGVFTAASPAEARALSDEQMRFVFAVLRDRPVATLGASLNAMGEQFTQVGLPEFRYASAEFQNFERKIPSSVVAQLRTTAAFRGTMPIDLIGALTWPLLLASVMVIGWAARRADLREQALLGAWTLLGWIANVAICGALSTPHERYNMRVIWLLPIAASVIVARAVIIQRRAPIARNLAIGS